LERFNKNYQRDKVEDDKMGITCSMHGNV